MNNENTVIELSADLVFRHWFRELDSFADFGIGCRADDFDVVI